VIAARRATGFGFATGVTVVGAVTRRFAKPVDVRWAVSPR